MQAITSIGVGQLEVAKLINGNQSDILPGWPLMYKIGNNDLGTVVTPAMPVSLARFAGIAESKVAYTTHGSNEAAQALVVRGGSVLANVYRPTAAEIVSGPYVLPVPGVHLFPMVKSGVPCLVPMDFHTGIVLVDDISAEDEGAMGVVEEGTGILVSFDAREVRAAGHLVWLAPETSATIKAHNYSGATTAQTTTQAGLAGDPTGTVGNYPRPLRIVSSGTAGDIAAGTITVKFLDAFTGEEITETFTVTVNVAVDVTTSRCASRATYFATPATDGTAVVYTLKTAPAMGMYLAFPAKPVVLATRYNSTTDSAPTLAVDATVVSKNIFTPSTAPDSSKNFHTWLRP